MNSVSKMKSSVAHPPCRGQDVQSAVGEMDENSPSKERRDDLISDSASAFPVETLTGNREAVEEEEVAKDDIAFISNCCKSCIPCKRWRGRKPLRLSMHSLRSS